MDRSSFADATTPRDLNVQLREQRLIVEWKDGARHEFPLARLRRVCPCATCRTEREQEQSNPLRVLKADPAKLKAVHAALVGRYAIRFEWSDGHSSGIYDFRFLRSLGDSGEMKTA